MRDTVRVILVDNLDSFTWNLVEEFARRGSEVEVWRNHVDAEMVLSRVPENDPGLLVISPGPGSPRESGCCIPLVRMAERKRVPLFGVCLGLQVMVEALGGKVSRAGEAVHGRASRVEHDGSPLFDGIPSPFPAARYHSLAAVSLPDPLIPMARTGEIIMAAGHQQAPMLGVQFHPESILTPDGGRLIDNLLRLTRHVAG